MLLLRGWTKRHQLMIAALIVIGTAVVVGGGLFRLARQVAHRPSIVVWNVSRTEITGISVRSHGRDETVLRGALLPDAMIVETLPDAASGAYDVLLDGVPAGTCVGGPPPNDRLVIKITAVRPLVITCESSVRGDD